MLHYHHPPVDGYLESGQGRGCALAGTCSSKKVFKKQSAAEASRRQQGNADVLTVHFQVGNPPWKKGEH